MRTFTLEDVGDIGSAANLPTINFASDGPDPFGDDDDDDFGAELGETEINIVKTADIGTPGAIDPTKIV